MSVTSDMSDLPALTADTHSVASNVAEGTLDAPAPLTTAVDSAGNSPETNTPSSDVEMAEEGGNGKGHADFILVHTKTQRKRQALKWIKEERERKAALKAAARSKGQLVAQRHQHERDAEAIKDKVDLNKRIAIVKAARALGRRYSKSEGDVSSDIEELADKADWALQIRAWDRERQLRFILERRKDMRSANALRDALASNHANHWIDDGHDHPMEDEFGDSKVDGAGNVVEPLRRSKVSKPKGKDKPFAREAGRIPPSMELYPPR
ncbi:hypothetical protein PENSPDRAFT_672231 [Peniophora sp. CONT]|nr:hypothetical protein PENSPDRAFT_672231 [Peniophora sp. CONT]